MLLGDPQAQLPAPLLLACPPHATLPTPLPTQTLGPAEVFSLQRTSSFSSQLNGHGASPMTAQPVKNPPAMQETREVQGQSLEKAPGGGSGTPLQYSCVENPMDRGAWWITVQRGSKEVDMTERLS